MPTGPEAPLSAPPHSPAAALLESGAGPDKELVFLIESGQVPPGRAIDLGTGAGHDAAYLALKGFKVLAVDRSAQSIALARATSRAARLGVAVDFRVEDVLRLSSPKGSANFLNDRHCFHRLAPENRAIYIRRTHDVLVPGGHLFLRAPCEGDPPTPGTWRFSRRELEGLFAPAFEPVEMKTGFSPSESPTRVHVCLLRRRP